MKKLTDKQFKAIIAAGNVQAIFSKTETRSGIDFNGMDVVGDIHLLEIANQKATFVISLSSVQFGSLPAELRQMIKKPGVMFGDGIYPGYANEPQKDTRSGYIDEHNASKRPAEGFLSPGLGDVMEIENISAASDEENYPPQQEDKGAAVDGSTMVFGASLACSNANQTSQRKYKSSIEDKAAVFASLALSKAERTQRSMDRVLAAFSE